MKKFKGIRAFFKTSKDTTEDNEPSSGRKPNANLEAISSTLSCLNEYIEAEAADGQHDSAIKTSLASTSSTVDNVVFVAEICSESLGAISENDLGTLATGPSQPRLNFPQTKFGDKLRSFSAKFYGGHNWVEYSVKEDKVYCFVCRQFSTGNIRDQNETFSKSGFKNWKKTTEALQKHALSSCHSQCAQMYVAYKKTAVLGDVHQQIAQQHQGEIEQNRDHVKKLIDVILLLVRQGLPLRGHRENLASTNTGNFLEISQLLAKYDTSFSIHLEKHTSYTSPKIQNEIIEIIAQLTLDKIVTEVKACGFFSIMVDEARCFKEEQLSISIRYAKNLDTEERFLGFIDCSTSRDAKSLATLILDFLKKNNLADVPILAQSYDGASVMSGKHRGLQSIIKETHPQAIYIHCLAHKLNLVVVDSCKKVSAATAFFNTLEALYIHFAQPGNHARLQEMHEALGIKSGRAITSLSTTRWSCRFENCRAVLTNYEAINAVLEDEINKNQDKNSVEAIGLLSCIQKPEFVVCLHVFHSVLSVVNVVSKYFQGKKATLGQASNIITGTMSAFEKNRNQFDDIWKKIEEFAEKHEISLEPTRISKRKRQQPEMIKDFLIESTLGKSSFIDLPSDTNAYEYWKINIYNQVMDNIIGNWKKRFDNLPLAQSVDSFLKLDLKNGEAFINNFKDILKIDTTLFQAETLIIKSMMENKKAGFDLENLKTEVKKDLCPNLYKLLQAAIVLPVSSAGCERSFSAMRRIKTWLRATMCQERFSNLSLLNIENEIIKNQITADDILKIFAKKNRKLKLV